MIEDKNIVYVSCGATHVMAIDVNGRLFGWGEGEMGSLGFGDGKKRASIVPISFFEDKRVIDVACGEKFTVVIAEVYNSKLMETVKNDDHKDEISFSDIKNYGKLKQLKNQKN
jgi:hypothetical protein